MPRFGSLGERIYYIRSEVLETSAVALAAAMTARGVDVSQSSISRYERNERMPGADFIAALTEIAGLQADWVLTGRGTPRSRQVRRRPVIPVRGTKVRLRVPETEIIAELGLPLILQSTSNPSALGLADSALFLENDTSHAFEAAVVKDWALDDLGAAGVDAPREAWERLRSAPGMVAREDPHEGELLIFAHARISVFPALWKWEAGSWYNWLNALDEEAAGIGAFADALEDYGDEVTQLHGNLHLIRSLAVHPVAQGFQFGARLLAHGLWRLHMEGGEFAIAVVGPTGSPFDRTARDQTEPRRLVSYFERMGFLRPPFKWDDPFRDEYQVVYAILGTHISGYSMQMNFRGVGDIGVPQTSEVEDTEDL